MAGTAHAFGQELGARINDETKAMKMPVKRVQAPMPVRYSSVRAGPHRATGLSAAAKATTVDRTRCLQFAELQMEASVQASLSAEVEQAGAPAAKRQLTAGGASVGGAGGAGSSVAGSAIRAPAIFMQLVKELRSGTAAMRADAALEMANMAEQSKHNRAGITWADAIG